MRKVVALVLGFWLMLGLALPAAAAEPGAAVQGLVTDESGRPLAGAEVEVYRLETGLTKVLTTDSGGRFRLEAPGLANGQMWQLRAVAAGYKTAETGWIELAQSRYQRFRLAAARGDLAITVANRAGEPFTGAEVRVIGPNGVVAHDKLTGAAYQVPGLAAGEYRVLVWANGAAAPVQTVTVVAGRRTATTVFLDQAGLAVSGEVLSSVTGAPVVGAAVKLLRDDGTLVKLGYTDEGGLFRFDLAEGTGGTYKALVSSPGYRSTATEPTAAAEGGNLDWSGSAALQLTPLTGTVSGTLLDSEGHYLAKVPVVLEQKGFGQVAEGITSDKGVFSFEGVAAGSEIAYRVTANHDGVVAATPWAPISAGVNNELPLQARKLGYSTYGEGTVSGLVVDQSGAPVSGAKLELIIRGRVAYTAYSRADGTFLFDDVTASVAYFNSTAEPYRLRVSKDGFATASEVVVAGAETSEFTVTHNVRTVVRAVLHPVRSTVRGRVVDDRGRGIAGATVWVRTDGGQFEAKVKTDAAGWYKADEAPAGAAYRYTVSAEAKGYRPVEGVAAAPVVQAFQALPTLKLAYAQATVMGQVHLPDGTPQAEAAVALWSQGRELGRAITGEDGTYRFTVTVPTGDEPLLQTAHATCCGPVALEISPEELQAAAGGTLTRDLTMRGPSGLAGRIFAADGSAGAGVLVEILADGLGVVGSTRSDDTGLYRFETLPADQAGTFWVRAGVGETRTLHLPGQEGAVPVVQVTPGVISIQDLMVK